MTISASGSGVGHTPGPWSVTDYGDCGNVIRFEIDGPLHRRICEIADFGLEVAEAHPTQSKRAQSIARNTDAANARLISAAPALLEARKEIQRAVGFIPPDADGDGWAKVPLKSIRNLASAISLATKGTP